ncbi:MAG: hypothetical protein IT548_13365 [Alphaproteobacteria bacterium]|nr:hypothetical protein [Alphaproteobacteria bacterium]
MFILGPVGFATTEVIVLIIYGALALLVYGWNAEDAHLEFVITLSNFRTAILMSTGFVILSGYIITSFFVYLLLQSRHWPATRTALNAALFLAHAMFFLYLIGTPPLSRGLADMILPFILGVAATAAAEVTTVLLWGRFSAKG